MAMGQQEDPLWEGVKVLGVQLLVLAQLATYVMAAIRWFSTEHDTFWFGFKELVWALCPIVNFTYVWDWWLAFLVIVLELVCEGCFEEIPRSD